jgi:hypothetical protein
MNAEELKEEAQAVAFWLSPENQGARRELAERRPELGMWLSMVEKRVNEKLAEVEKEEVAMKA